MRPTLILATVAVLASLASAAAAQTQTQAPAPITADISPAPLAPALLTDPAEDARLAESSRVRLADLDARLETDEVTMTGLRDRELAAENARIRKIKPALPFHGATFLPRWY